MTMHLYAYYHKRLGYFHAPITLQFNEKQVTEQLKRSLHQTDDKTLSNMRELDLYHIGTYDDSNGTLSVDSKPVFLCDVASLCPVVKEVESNG